MTYTYFKGHKAIYDYDKQDWFYEDNGESATKNPRTCKRCGQDSIKEGDIEYDYCLGNLGENVTSACCGHGVKQGFILFENGRLFIEGNNDLKYLLQDLGLLRTDEEVMNIRTEIADKFFKPLCKENGFDVDVDCTNGFTIIPKGEL